MRTRDTMRLWRDNSLPDGLELLRASCFDHRYPAHFHEEFVIATFTRGAERYRVSAREGVANAGTLMIIPPGEVHSAEAVERDRGWDYCAFYPSQAFLERIADGVLGGQGALDFGSEVVRHDPVVTRNLLRAHAVVSGSQDAIEKQCAVYEAFGAVIGHYGKRGRRRSRPPTLDVNIRDAVAFLQEHYDRPVTVREVASVVGLSEYHFMRAFRAKSGLSVHSYLTQIRLHRAKALLARGVAAVETALAVGFFDQSHLTNQFRKYFGVTPGAFVAASR